MTILSTSFEAKKVIEKALESGVVAGFEVVDVKASDEAGVCVRDYYAVVGGGLVITARVTAKFNEFNPEGTIWTVCAGIPEGAEYVGNYTRPEFVA